MVSQLHLYSIGIAAENKPLDSRHLNVTPTETLTGLDGELNFAPETKRRQATDAWGNAYEVGSTEDITLTAEWLPYGSNRVTPPDIRRGEHVAIYRVGDSDQYLWSCLGLRDDLRRLETVIYAFNGSPNPASGHGVDIQNCYFLEISTHKRMITLGTSQANDEPYGYTFQLNTGEGRMSFEDTLGNTVHIDSGRHYIEATNASETSLQLDQQDIYMFCHNDLQMEIGHNATIRVGNDFGISVGNDVQLSAGNQASMTAGSDFGIKAGGSYMATANGEAVIEGKAGAALIGAGSSISLGASGVVWKAKDFSVIKG